MTDACAPSGEPRLRLFFALDLDERDQRRVAAWRDGALAAVEGLRPVADESLHVTLAFLGGRPEGEVAEVARVGLDAVADLRAPVVRPRAVVGVPARRPRLFALDLDDPAGAAAVHAALTGALETAGLHRAEERPFWPHVTLARVRGGGRGRGRPVRERPAPLEPAAHGAELRLASVTLYRSLLSPAGARYEALAARELGPPD